MNRFSLTGNNESLKIKKELEALMKGSKEEYHNASTPEREAFLADMGLQPKMVPENIVLKGKEVLEVSGSQRRGSSSRTIARTDKPRTFDAPFSFYPNKNDILGLMDDSDEFNEKGADSLFMTMTGESVFKAEKKDPRAYRLHEGNSEVFQDIGELIAQYFSSESVNDTKPAIVASSNTTKSMQFATRKPKPKKYEPPKKLIPKKKAIKPTRKLESGGSARRSDGGTNDSPLSTLNFSVEKNLTFDKLDEEFYDILKHQLKLDIKDGIALSPTMEDDEENLDGLQNQSIEEKTTENRIERGELVDEATEEVNGVRKSQEVLVKDEVKPENSTANECQSKDPTSSEAISGGSKQPVDSGFHMKNRKKKSATEKGLATKAPNETFGAQRAPVIVEDKVEIDSGNLFTDKEAALKALSLPIEISNEDIISVIGEKPSSSVKQDRISENSTVIVSKDGRHYMAGQRRKSFLTSWMNTNSKKVQIARGPPQPAIHHFCTSTPAIQLPGHQKGISRCQHSPDRFRVFKPAASMKMPFETEGDSLPHPTHGDFNKEIQPHILAMIDKRGTSSENEKRLTELASKIIEDALKQPDKSTTEKTFMKLQNIVDNIFDENDESALQVGGQKAELNYNDTRPTSMGGSSSKQRHAPVKVSPLMLCSLCRRHDRLYWVLAPPKFDLPPSVVKEQLIPKYQGVSNTNEEDLEMNDELNEEPEEESSSEDDDEQEAAAKFRERILRRAHGSAPIERTRGREKLKSKIEVKDESDGDTEALEEIENQSKVPRGMQSISEMRQLMTKLREEKIKKEEESEKKEASVSEFSFDLPKRRTVSQPLLRVSDSALPQFESDYDTAAEELEYQSNKILEMKENLLKRTNKSEDDADGQCEILQEIETGMKNHDKIEIEIDESDTAREPTIDSVKCPHENASSQGTRSSIAHRSRLDTCSTIMSKRLSTKRSSFRKLKPRLPKISSIDPEHEKRIKEFIEKPVRKIKKSVSLENLVPEAQKSQSNLKRRKSLSNMPDFEEVIGHKFNKENGKMLLWIKDEYWYKWIDELYPPSIQSEQEKVVEPLIEGEGAFEEDIFQQIDIIEPLVKNDTYQLLLKEIDSMTSLIEATEAAETLAIHLCRRGACYRKVGDLKRAREDLERSIELEPKLADAYWHLHFLHLLLGDSKKALADLDYVLTHNTKHFDAYRSRAELYSKKGDLTQAIFNYSQAIKLRPENPDVFYARAYLFEQRGDILLALGDFREATNLQPSRTEGIRNIGMYHIENRSWTAAVNDFTALIAQEPYNSLAYLYRGRASANLAHYESALKDISTSIHLDPRNNFAFYIRGCLLRKAAPRKALQDLSTSLLLDNSVSNVLAYLHRGILYTEMKRWEEAMSDFEQAVKLDSHIPAAHVNLGLIYMTKMNNPHLAMRKFNVAIRVDPTYVRAYICRAEAHQVLHFIQGAIHDYTRAIHLRPDVTEYRMTRGKLLMQHRKFDLASYHIRQCAVMGKGGAAPTTQQAAILSFLQNHKQAIDILEKSLKTKEVPHLHLLLGKTKMKAKLYTEAIESFENVLKLLVGEYNITYKSQKKVDDKSTWPLPAAEVYYLIGIAHTELIDHISALDAFSNALKINPEYSKAYYQRGLTKMRLRHAKAVQDFNRALAYNPKFFQAYLSRAEYYGMKGRYAKAILNCNEAIRLQPNSIRGYLNRGALKYYIQAYKFAVKDLSQAIFIDASCSLAYFNRAVCYQEMKHYQKALKDYGVVSLIEKKESLKVLQNRGLLYLEVGELENALKDFLAAAEIEPKNPKLHHTLGICYHRLGLIDKAVECYSNALENDKFFVEALLGRGNAVMDHATVESNSMARRDFLRALRLNPSCLTARVNLAYGLQVQGRFKAAWIEFSKCIDIDENFKSAYEGRAVVNLQMGNTFGAFLDINKALKIEASAEFLTNRGVINQFMGDTVNAMRDYQSAIKKDPSYSLAYYNAANLYLGHRQFQQALEYYDRAIGWDENDESAYINRAVTKVMMKNFDGALEDFSKAAVLSPFSAHLYFNRANLNASMGRYESAEKDYTEALALQPGDALVYKRRADVRSKLSLKDEALADYKQAVLIQAQRIKKSRLQNNSKSSFQI